MTQPHPTDHLPAARWLLDRRLVQADADEVKDLDLLMGETADRSSLDGVILTGKHAPHTARGLRRTRPELMVLVEPSSFASEYASEDEPFVLPKDGLFATPLEELITQQLDNGEPYALTPTGYISNIDADALKAVINQGNQLDTERLVITVPIDSGWLKQSHVRQLTAVLRRSRHPLLVSLGAKGDPLDSAEKARGLVELMTIENISFARVDHLVGLEALARTTGAASFGTIPSRRRITPPREKGQAFFKRSKVPYVYVKPLHRFMSGDTRKETYANTSPPTCDDCCDGRQLDSFTDKPHDIVAAMNHNISSLIAVAAMLTGTADERRSKLASLYYDVAMEHVRLSALTGRRINVPIEQQMLAQLIATTTTVARTTTP